VDGLGRRPEVTLAGFVDDVGPFYDRADVVVAPMARGGGTCIKVLEAFAHRVPVVTTSAGASGLDVTGAEHLVVAESVEGLAAATRVVLDHPDLADRLVAAAFTKVWTQYRREVVAEAVRAWFERARTTAELSERSPRP
jgi:glycosyltransferase involved in cell wall biosynthesis